MNVLNNAREYLNAGYSVIPLIPGTKRPATEWKPFQSRKPTEIDVQSLFAGVDRNIGIVTGSISGLVVVDIDNVDNTSPKIVLDTFISKWPTHRIARTARGGYHLYYQYAGKDVGNSIGKLSNGVDVRGEGGYVVAAPSWVKYESGYEGAYEWVEDGKPLPLPNDLRDFLLAELTGQINTTTVSLDIVTTDKEDGHKLWVRILLNGFTAHKHNQEIKDAARYLFRQGLSELAIINTLSVLNSKDSTPLPIAELTASVKSGIKYEQSREYGKQANTNFAVRDLMDFAMSVGNYNDKWLIKDWLPESALIMLAAPPENYKTWIALEAAVQVALGDKATPFLGQFEGTAKPYPVLIVQQEDYSGKIFQRINAIIHGKSEGAAYPMISFESDGEWVLSFGSPYNAPIYFHTDAELRLDNPASIAALEQRIKDYGIKLVIIDPLYTLGSVDNFFAEMAQELQPIKKMREKYGVSFILVHHNKKGGGQGREAIFGSQLLNGAVEGVWQVISNDRSDQRVIKRYGKIFSGKQDDYSIEFDIDTPDAELAREYSMQDTMGVYISTEPVSKTTYRSIVDSNVIPMMTDGDEHPAKFGKHENPVYKIIKDSQPLTMADIQASYGLQVSDLSEKSINTTVRTAVKRLMERGSVVRDGDLYTISETVEY